MIQQMVSERLVAEYDGLLARKMLRVNLEERAHRPKDDGAHNVDLLVDNLGNFVASERLWPDNDELKDLFYESLIIEQLIAICRQFGRSTSENLAIQRV